MSRRLLIAGLSTVVLVGALAWAGRTAAKPPDLPLVDKSVLAPPAPVEASLPAPPNPFTPAAAPVESLMQAPELFPMRPSARRMMASCLLFVAHPLLTLAPTDGYVDFDDDDAPLIPSPFAPPAVAEAPHGSLIIGLGFNSDAGLTGSIEFTPATIGGLGCSEITKAFWRLIPHVADEPLQHVEVIECGNSIGFHLVQFVDGGTVAAPATPEPIQAPKDVLPDDSTQSVCPWMRQHQSGSDGHAAPSADDFSHDVLHNLQMLHNAHALLEKARELGRGGHVLEALDLLDLAHAICPGGRLDDAVQQAAVEIFAPIYCGSPDGGYGAADQSEQPADKTNAEKADELLKQFSANFKEGKYEEALRCASQAQELDPGNAAAAAAVQLCREVMQRQDSQQRPADGGYPHPEAGKRRSGPVSEIHSEIEQKLMQPVTVNFDNAPLHEVIDDLRTWQDLNIYVDKAALEADEISLDHRVTVKLENISLKSALHLILKGAGPCTYVVKDGALEITTKQAARGKMERVAYQVADILEGDLHCPGVADESAKKPPQATLIKLLTTTVSPKDWSENGGPGTIDFHPQTHSLVINQTVDIQEQVVDFLNGLRRKQGPHAEEPEERCTGFHLDAVQDKPVANNRAEALMKECHEAMAAGQVRKAAALARQAFACDPEQAAADPLVYKMLLADDNTPPPVDIAPCLPPVDPTTPDALDHLYHESSRVEPASGAEEQQPPPAPGHGVAKPMRSSDGANAVGCGKDGGATESCLDAWNQFLDVMRHSESGSVEAGMSVEGFRMFGQFRRGGAVWHMLYHDGGLSVWASPAVGMPPEKKASDDGTGD
jgi:tetratricopeptide (TPR) repeat protein